MDFIGRILVRLAAPIIAVLCVAPASASTDMSQAVRNCTQQYGVSGGYYVKTLTVGKEQSLYVPPGGSVNPSQAEQINTCIIRQTSTGSTSGSVRAVANPPNVPDTCRAEYSQKLRLTNNGLDYQSNIIGARLICRLFGRDHGIQLLNEEYDRCLRQAANRRNRCKGSVLVGGKDYCIRRPYR